MNRIENPDKNQSDQMSTKKADLPIPYLQRIRSYYQALGFDTPYQWASFTDVPFTFLKKPLSQCRVAIVTTAAPYQPGKGEQGPGAKYNAAAKFFQVYSMPSNRDPDLRISHISYDRQHTTARDMNSWFPLLRLREMAMNGRIGSVAKRFHGLPTDRSQSVTMSRYCPEIYRRLCMDNVDAVVLVPNCPVCHQSVSLLARYLESRALSTVIMACAKDIVEQVGVPRLLFNDFPLGNAAGKPGDPVSQEQTLALALELLESASHARSTLCSPQVWAGDPVWKEDFYNIKRLDKERIAQLAKAFRHQKRLARKVKMKTEDDPATN